MVFLDGLPEKMQGLNQQVPAPCRSMCLRGEPEMSPLWGALEVSAVLPKKEPVRVKISRVVKAH